MQSGVEQHITEEGDFNESLLSPESREENKLRRKLLMISVHMGTWWMRLVPLCGAGDGRGLCRSVCWHGHPASTAGIPVPQ